VGGPEMVPVRLRFTGNGNILGCVIPMARSVAAASAAITSIRQLNTNYKEFPC